MKVFITDPKSKASILVGYLISWSLPGCITNDIEEADFIVCTDSLFIFGLSRNPSINEKLVAWNPDTYEFTGPQKFMEIFGL